MQSVNFNTLVLGYQHHTSPNWFKKILNNPQYVQGVYYTDAGFKFALTASKNKKKIKDLQKLNEILQQNGLPLRIEEQHQKYLYIITAEQLNYFKFGLTKDLDTRVATYKSVLKGVTVQFSQVIEYDQSSFEKMCMNFLETQLNLNRDSEKFDFRDQQHLNEIIERLKQFIQSL